MGCRLDSDDQTRTNREHVSSDPRGQLYTCGRRPPSSLCAPRSAKSRASTGAPRHRYPSVSPRWTLGFPAGRCRLAPCMRSLGAATARLTAQPPRFFAAGIAARTRGKVLWCVTRLDLAPALAQAGLNSDRVIYLEGGDEKTIHACFERRPAARRPRRRGGGGRALTHDRFAATPTRGRRVGDDRHRTSPVKAAGQRHLISASRRPPLPAGESRRCRQLHSLSRVSVARDGWWN